MPCEAWRAPRGICLRVWLTAKSVSSVCPLRASARATFVLVLTVLAALDAFGQTAAELAARCRQLVTLYDRYGAGSAMTSDGLRNHTRIRAELDCHQGRYVEGIVLMEELLRRKNFVPPPPVSPPLSPPVPPPISPLAPGTASQGSD